MPTRDEVRVVARRKMGRLSVLVFREWGLLERLLAPDEEIEAMALSKLRGGVPIARQRLVVVTPRRVILAEKGFLTGRERVREIDWTEIRGIQAIPPTRLTFELTDGPLELTFVQPPSQLGAVADAVRARIRGAAPEHDTAELHELARRKLGRMIALGVESHVIALAGLLEAQERVLDVAFVAGKPGGLLTVTTRRVVFVPSAGVGTGPPDVIALDAIGGAALDPDGTVSIDDRRWRNVAPAERAASLVDIVRARQGGGGSYPSQA